ncbi:UNVERIFIED_CONTAM: hypothetical protein K2H54_059652, partial [Gekko kuhli]
ANVRKTVCVKEPGRVILERDEDLDVESKSGDQVVPKRQRRTKRVAKQKQRKELIAYWGKKMPE